MSITPDLFEIPPASFPPGRKSSPTRTLIILMILIFMAELAAMVVIYFLRLPNYFATMVLDGLIMTALISPSLYFLQLNPLLKEIDERTRAEHALSANERLLRKVLETLPVGVWIIDKNGKIVYGNPAGKRIWGGARYVRVEQYAEYQAWWADSGKPVEPDEWGGTKAVAHGETVLDDELEILSFDGLRKTILCSAVPILDSENAIRGAIVMNQDITLRRQGQKALTRTNELLERIFSNVDTLIAYMDRDFNFIRVNETYAKAGDHSIDFFTGKNHFDLYPNTENEEIFRRVVETGEPFSIVEKPFEYPDFPGRGVTYWNWSLQPVKDEDGLVEGLVLSLLDVTSRKLTEMQLARQNQELLALSEEESRQRELAEGLVDAVITLITSLELDQVLGSILEQIRKVVPFGGAAIVLLEGKSLRMAGFLGFEDHPEAVQTVEKLRAPDDHPLIQQVYTTLQPVIIDSVKDQTDWRAIPGLEWVSSCVAVPLIAGGELTGIITLTSDSPGIFNQRAVSQLRAFAAPAALALHNARVYRAESDARQAAETLSAAAQALTQTLDLEQVINTLLDHLHMIIHSDTAEVTLIEDETRLAVRAIRGYDHWMNREDIPSLSIDGITDSVLQRVKMTRKSLVIPNPVTYPSGEVQVSLAHIGSWLIVPIIASDKLIGMVELGKAGQGIFTREQAQWAEALVGQAGVAIQNAWLFGQVRTSSERLQSLTRKLVEIQESERYHIARELHDEAGQALSSLKISLGRLELDPECPQHMRQRLANLKALTDGVLEELHRLAMDLRPATLDHLGLVAALEQAANNLNSDCLSVQFKAIGFGRDRLPKNVEISLYRIVQEALTNIMRHAHANNVGILLERSENRVKVFVEDDGTGFSADLSGEEGRLGLVGMRERAEMFGGTLTIESSPGEGTAVIVEVPDVNSHYDR